MPPEFAPDRAGGRVRHERRAIVEWLNKKKTSPLTHEPLDATALVPQHVVRKLIESFREKRRQR